MGGAFIEKFVKRAPAQGETHYALQLESNETIHAMFARPQDAQAHAAEERQKISRTCRGEPSQGTFSCMTSDAMISLSMNRSKERTVHLAEQPSAEK